MVQLVAVASITGSKSPAASTPLSPSCTSSQDLCQPVANSHRNPHTPFGRIGLLMILPFLLIALSGGWTCWLGYLPHQAD
ncbi:MAG: hypothetical protein IMZ53_16790 [Thermoplasmata archaeon]|nr:hypothetical protein [Thermoplasmata archaeon]